MRTHETVFVYGQLRQGFWNEFLLKNCLCLGSARTQDHFSMYVCTFPYVSSREKLYPIIGDIYLVDSGTLAKLDSLKGHPYWYERRKVPVEFGSEIRLAWIYFCADHHGQLLASGDYLDAIPAGR